MNGTMRVEPLLIKEILDYGERYFPDSVVVTRDVSGVVSSRTYATVADNAGRLAQALAALGIEPGDRVATLCWNRAEHLEAYLAIPCMGAVMLTLNLRLGSGQLNAIVKDAAPKVLIADASLLDVADTFVAASGIEDVIVVQDVPTLETERPGWECRVHAYDRLLSQQDSTYPWPDLDENDAAAMCYTTGTTGQPKGVVYSHRSVYLHSLAACTVNSFAIGETDRVLMIVPMFHANAWGMPYSAWMSGSDVIFPAAALGGDELTELIVDERATFAAAVPTIWTAVLESLSARRVEVHSLRMVVSGGSAASQALIDRWTDTTGVPMVQGWGMTETSPLAALAREPKSSDPAEARRWRGKTGRPVFGVRMRVRDDEGHEARWGTAEVGEVQVRGPWITGMYHHGVSPESFEDGWLRTGDVGRVDERGYLQITDRTKDVIKSGGEWVSSVELEDHLHTHAGVAEVAVIGVPDDRWEERPMVFVVAGPQRLTPEDLVTHLKPLVPQWWLPERWSFVEEIPKTSVGKLDKVRLRQLYADPDAGLIVERATPRRAELGEVHNERQHR